MIVLGFVDFAVFYKTSGFVNGGQKDRGIGSHGYGHAIATSLFFNTIYNVFLTQSLSLDNLAGGAIDTAGYILAGVIANKHYKIAGQSANTLSEIIVGAVAGYLIVKLKEKFNQKQVEKALLSVHEAMLLKLSSQDLCLDVDSILNPVPSSPVVAAQNK